MITILLRGGYGQKITILHREGGSTETPKSDYVIYGWPLMDLFIPNFLLSRSTLHVLCMFYGSVEREFFCIVYRIECISSMTAFIRRWAVQIKSLLGPLWSWNEKSKILIIWFRKLWLHVTPGHQPETETRGRQNKQKVHLLIHLHRRR